MNAQSNAKLREHLHLGNSPLVRVLCQIRWQTFHAFDPERAIDEMGAALANKYPVSETGHEYQMVLTPEGVQQGIGETLYRLSSADGKWNVTLAKTFVSLETTSYSGHVDFIERLGEVVDVLNDAFEIPTWLRIGYRYTNRISGQADLASLQGYFRSPSILGGEAWKPDGAELIQSMTESAYTMEGATVLVRSASLAPYSTNDPTLEPISEHSWVLDFDASFEAERGNPLISQDIMEKANILSDVCYHLFDGLISEAFVERFK